MQNKGIRSSEIFERRLVERRTSLLRKVYDTKIPTLPFNAEIFRHDFWETYVGFVTNVSDDEGDTHEMGIRLTYPQGDRGWINTPGELWYGLNEREYQIAKRKLPIGTTFDLEIGEDDFGAIEVVNKCITDMLHGGDKDNIRPNPERDRRIEAWEMAKEFVKQDLPVPYTAFFGKQDPMVAVEPTGFLKYRVTGWVDSLNEFDVVIRKEFVCDVEFDGDTVRLRSWKDK